MTRCAITGLGLAVAFAIPAMGFADTGPAGTPLIEIGVRSITLKPAELSGLRLSSAVVLTSENADFGGFSGLSIEAGHMVAISDRGHWLLADLEDGPRGLVPVRAGYAAITDADGARIERSGADAEGLTIRDGAFVVSFEQDHRIMFHLEQGRLGDTFRTRAFERLSGNAGLEGLATLPDGWLIAFAEEPVDGAAPFWTISHAGTVEGGALPLTGPERVTGADVGPDGRLYLVLRDYRPIFGLSIRIERYDLTEEGFPLPGTRYRMAHFLSGSGIDNMEGISVWTDAEGATHLTLISDDNFSILQNTLLVDFEVLPDAVDDPVPQGDSAATTPSGG
ncbi:MAG: esterase-like activity of phytase family protein [Pseudomonadota bacterium]